MTALYKTPFGKHYHTTEGCHGATIPVASTSGLEPCLTCCDKSTYVVGAPSKPKSITTGGAAADKSTETGWIMIGEDEDGNEFEMGMNGEVLSHDPSGEVIIPTVLREPLGIRLISKLPNVEITPEALTNYYRVTQSAGMYMENFGHFAVALCKNQPITEGYDTKDLIPGYVSFKKRYPHFDALISAIFSQENVDKVRRAAKVGAGKLINAVYKGSPLEGTVSSATKAMGLA